MGEWNKLQGIFQVPVKDGDIFLSAQVSNNVKAKFEDWMEGTARRRVFDMREYLTSKELEDSLDSVTRCVAAKTLAWGGAAMLECFQSLPGAVKFTLILAAEAETESKGEVKNNPPVTADRLLDLWMNDEPSRIALRGAIKEINDSCPNFLSPPVRARGL